MLRWSHLFSSVRWLTFQKLLDSPQPTEIEVWLSPLLTDSLHLGAWSETLFRPAVQGVPFIFRNLSTITLRAEKDLPSQAMSYLYVGSRLTCGFTCYAKTTDFELCNEKVSLL